MVDLKEIAFKALEGAEFGRDPLQQVFGNEDPNYGPPSAIQDDPNANLAVAIDDGQTPSVPLPADVVKSRADKASFGLTPVTDKTKGDFVDALATNKENNIRQDVSGQVDLAKSQNAYQILSKGGPDAIDRFLKFTTPTDPDTVFESHYSKQYMDHLLWPTKEPNSSSWLKDAMVENPEMVQKTMDMGEKISTLREYILTKIQNLDAQNTFGGTAGHNINLAADYAAGLIPLRVEAGMRGNIPGVGFFHGLLGENIEEQRRTLYETAAYKSLDEAKAIVDKISAHNNGLIAQGLLSQLYDHSGNDITAANLSTLYEVALLGTLKPTGKLLRNAVRDVIDDKVKVWNMNDHGYDILPPPEVRAPNAAGDFKTAAVNEIVIDKINDFSGKSHPLDEARRELQAPFDTYSAEVSSSPTGKEIKNRINELMASQGRSYWDAVNNLFRVNRTPAIQAVEDVAKMVEESIADIYKGIDNTVQVGHGIWDPIGNRYLYNVAITRADGKLFQSADVAHNFGESQGFVVQQSPERRAYLEQSIRDAKVKLLEYGIQKNISMVQNGYIPKDLEFRIANLQQGIAHWEKLFSQAHEGATVEQQGTGFYLNYVHALDETQPIVRNNLITTEHGEQSFKEYHQAVEQGLPSTGLPPRRFGTVGSIMSWVMSPTETMSITENAQRVIATHTPANLMALIHENSGPITSLDKKYWAPMDEYLRWMQRKIDPETSKTGYWVKTPEEMDNWYQTYKGRSPTLPEYEFYWAYKGLIAMDLGFRKMSLVTKKSRLGVAQYSFKVPGKSEFVKGGPAWTHTDPFEATRMDHIPWGADDNILVLSNKEGGERVIRANGVVNFNFKTPLDEAVKNGTKMVIRVYNPDLDAQPYSFGKAKGKRIRFIVGDFKMKPLSWGNQLPNRGGGHIVPDYGYYLKMPNIQHDEVRNYMPNVTKKEGKSELELKKDHYNYRGDHTLAPVRNRAEGEDIAKHLNVVLGMLRRAASGPTEEELARWENEGGAVRRASTKVTTFKTSRGSAYQVHEDGTTTRNKAARPEHPGDSGLKERSVRTVYVKDSRVFSPPTNTAWRVVDHGDGSMSLATQNADGRWGISPDSRNITYETSPRVGLNPVELWKPDTLNGNKAYRGAHPGNEITEVNGSVEHAETPTLHQLAQDYANKHFTIADWDQFIDRFIKGGLPFDQDVHVVPRNVNINQTPKGRAYLQERYGDRFRDRTRVGSDAAVNNVEFTGERDVENLMTFKSVGTQDNPHFAYEPANYVSPITAMDRGLSRITNSLIMDDMKTFSVEHFLQQAKNWLKPDIVALLDHSPWQVFMEINQHSFIKDTPLIVKSTLLDNYMKAKNFLHVPSVWNNVVHAVSEELANQVYQRTGTRFTGHQRGVTFERIENLSLVKSPISFFRSIVFRADQGFFAPKAYFMQASTLFNIYAITPRHAPPATTAATLFAYSRLNRQPEIWADMDRKATVRMFPGTSNFQPGDWTMFTKGLEASGFHRVGSEHTFLNTPTPNNVITNNTQRFLKAGDVPFSIGAATTRVAAWYAAALEWRELNPTGRPTRQEWDSIFRRASDLDHNMSRAGASRLHTGFMAVPFMYQAYPLRLADLMFGKRLSTEQKARLIGASTLAFGVRYGLIGLGVPLVGGAVGDYLYDEAVKAGYVTGRNVFADIIAHGIVSALVGHMTGNSYDFERFGTKGLDPVTEVLSGQTWWWKLLSGPLGTHLSGLFKEMQGVVEAFKGGNFKLQDILDLTKEVSVSRDAQRLYIALRYGEWVTKNEQKLGDISAWNAFLMTVSGLHPIQGADELYRKQNIEHSMKLQEEDAAKRYVQLMERSFRSQIDNDPEGVREWNRRASVLLEGIGLERRAAVKARAAANRDLIGRVNFDLYNKWLNDMDAYKSTIDVQEKGKP